MKMLHLGFIALSLTAGFSAPALAQDQETGPCYFGECADQTTADKNQSDSYPGQRKSKSDAAIAFGTLLINLALQSGKNTAAQQKFYQQPQLSGICQTRTFWCQMNQRAPVQGSCWCNTAYGPINGQVIPQ